MKKVIAGDDFVNNWPADIPFLIVTPTFNSEAYLDETILSVVSQAGPFEIIYHVQDGGSSDRTIDILRRWKRLIESGDFPITCNRLRFSFASERDGGMYQAINRGVAVARPPGIALMGWVNSDDRLAPGALATLEVVSRTFPTARFFTARVAMIDDRGSLMGINLPIAYHRGALARGEHDGRTRNFVMQEGTFWRSDLWDDVGGLDERFRLAGDWDLWRRFAAHAPLHTVDTLIGFHRRRPGQLSSQMDLYYAEIDAAAAIPPGDHGDEPDTDMIRFDMARQRWLMYPDYARRLDVPLRQDTAGRLEATARIELLSGVRNSEGPHPEGGLPSGMRWIDDRHVEAEVDVPHAGRWIMTLRARNWHPYLRIRIARGEAVCYDGLVSAGENGADSEIEAPIWLEAGRNRLTIDSSVDLGDLGTWVFIVIDWYVRLPHGAGSAAAAGADARRLIMARPSWPRISVVVPTLNQGAHIERTLRSLIDQRYPSLEIIVIDGGSTDATKDVLACYADHLTHQHSSADIDRGAAIDRGFKHATGEVLAWLDGGDLLADDALFAIGAAFAREDAWDLVTGVCIGFDATGPVRRYLPCIADGPLSHERTLDIEGARLQGLLALHSAVFFSREIWEDAGAHVEERPPHDMAHDLWARFAATGARIEILGTELARLRVRSEPEGAPAERLAAGLQHHAVTLPTPVERFADTPAPPHIGMPLTIALVGDYGRQSGVGRAHKALATALAACGHRILPFAYDDPSGEPGEGTIAAAGIAAMLVANGPDLVIVADQPAVGVNPVDVFDLLVAGGTPTVLLAHNEAIVAGWCLPDGPSTALPPLAAISTLARRREVLAAAREGPHAILTDSVSMRTQIERNLGAGPAPDVRMVRPGVDCAIFRPQSRVVARRRLGVPEDTFIVLTAAAAPDEVDLAVAAFDTLLAPNKLLLSMEAATVSLSTGAVHHSGPIDSDDLSALHYAAADVLLSANGAHASTRVLIEAAATGCPVVAVGLGAAPEVVRDGETGLLAPPGNPAALARLLQRLHDDPLQRERLSANAVLHARSYYSLEACAWSFLTAIESLSAFRAVQLAPAITFTVEPAQPPAATYFSGKPTKQPMDDGWETGPGLSREPQPNFAMNLDAGYARLVRPHSRIFVFARKAGMQTLRVHARSAIPGRKVAISVNGVAAGVFVYDQIDGGIRETHSLRAALSMGMNRVDFDFEDTEGHTHDRDESPFLLEGFDVGEDAFADIGGWQPLRKSDRIAFARTERHVDMRMPWIETATGRIRVHTVGNGLAQLKLVFRNHLPGQLITITVNGASVGSVSFENSAFIRRHEVILPAVVVRGWNMVGIRASVVAGYRERDTLVSLEDVEISDVAEPIGRVRPLTDAEALA